MLWNAETGAVLNSFKGMPKNGNVQINSARSYIAFMSEDTNLVIWDFKRNRQLSQIDGRLIDFFFFEKGGDQIILHGFYIGYRALELRANKLRSFCINDSSVSGSEVLPSLIYKFHDTKITVDDSNNCSERDIIDVNDDVRRSARITSIALSPDSNLIAICTYDSVVLIYSLRNYAKVGELKGHESAVTSANFSPDGKYIITTSEDQPG